MDLALRLEQLPESATRTALKLGSNRTRLTQVQAFDHLATEEEIMDALVDHGYGADYQYSKVTWLNAKGQTVKSLAMSTPLKNEEGSSDLSKTLDTMLLLVAEVRRFTAVQNEGNERLMSALLKSQDRNDELREQVIKERSTTLALDLALQQTSKEDDFNYKEKALETLSNGIQHAANAYMATKNQLTPEALKNLVKNHPEIIDELVKDEEIVSIIGTRIMSSKLANESEIENVD